MTIEYAKICENTTFLKVNYVLELHYFPPESTSAGSAWSITHCKTIFASYDTDAKTMSEAHLSHEFPGTLEPNVQLVKTEDLSNQSEGMG